MNKLTPEQLNETGLYFAFDATEFPYEWDAEAIQDYVQESQKEAHKLLSHIAALESENAALKAERDSARAAGKREGIEEAAGICVMRAKDHGLLEAKLEATKCADAIRRRAILTTDKP